MRALNLVRRQYVRVLGAGAVVAVVASGAMAQADTTLTIPTGLDPVGIANSTMTSATPYVTAMISVGLVFIFAVAIYRLISRRAARIGR